MALKLFHEPKAKDQMLWAKKKKSSHCSYHLGNSKDFRGSVPEAGRRPNTYSHKSQFFRPPLKSAGHSIRINDEYIALIVVYQLEQANCYKKQTPQ